MLMLEVIRLYGREVRQFLATDGASLRGVARAWLEAVANAAETIWSASTQCIWRLTGETEAIKMHT